MLPLGGEVPFSNGGMNSFFTDSGRSSIRLFLRCFPDKEILVPDYLCKTIIDIFDAEEVSYEFYAVKRNLELDVESIIGKKFDVLYVINYFGMVHASLDKVNFDNIILLEDNVFNIKFSNTHHAKYWYAFNSFRKISCAPDGSEVCTNLSCELANTKLKEAEFSRVKLQAKQLKFDYLYLGKGSEEEYISLFSESESLLNDQFDVYYMSNVSHKIIMDVYYRYRQEQKKRKDKYELISKLLSPFECEMNFFREEYSFFILKCPESAGLRSFLSTQRVFLPIHWPEFGIENSLYGNLLSVPLFSNFSVADLKMIAAKIAFYLEK